MADELSPGGALGVGVEGGAATARKLLACDAAHVYTSTTYTGFSDGDGLYLYTIKIKNDNAAASFFVFKICPYVPGYTTPPGVLTLLGNAFTTCAYNQDIGAYALATFSVASQQPLPTGDNKLEPQSCG